MRRIDTSVFASDKFAFEMVEFAKAYRKPATLDMPAEWERQFVRGLELLLAECAVVKDEIERDCFVSRIYAWFMEKLSERRELDRDKDSRSRRREVDPAGEAEEDDEDLRKERFPPTNAGGNIGAQMYNGKAYPKVQGSRPPGESAAPQDNTGMLFLEEPQTEAELEMHNLWLAKRQQEVRPAYPVIYCTVLHCTPFCCVSYFVPYTVLSYLISSIGIRPQGTSPAGRGHGPPVAAQEPS